MNIISEQSIAHGLTLTTCTFDNLVLLNALRRIKGVSWDNPEGAVWFIARDGAAVVGSACYVEKNGQARFKSDAVLPSYRGKGIYKLLSAARLQYAEEQCISRATCFSSADSRHQFLKDGFVQLREDDNGIAFMERTF